MHKPDILLITGGSGSGKSLAIAEILKEMKSSGLSVGGILAPGRYLKTGEKEFDLELIPGGNKFFLSTRIQYAAWEAIGGFRFNPEALEAGLLHLKSLPGKHFQLYLLDEIGPFEIDGLLWAPAIPELLNQPVPMIWTVRERIIDQVCRKWNIDNPEIISLEKGKMSDPMGKIRIWLKKNVPGLF